MSRRPRDAHTGPSLYDALPLKPVLVGETVLDVPTVGVLPAVAAIEGDDVGLELVRSTKPVGAKVLLVPALVLVANATRTTMQLTIFIILSKLLKRYCGCGSLSIMFGAIMNNGK